MTLKDYILTCDENEEITVIDNTTGYSCGYFYNDECDPGELDLNDDWFNQIDRLAKKLTVTWAGNHECIVNMFELLDKNKDAIIEHNMFYSSTPRSWAQCMHSIISGNVSESWLKEFVDLL